MHPIQARALFTRSRLWDRVGIILSTLCLVHCLALPVVLTGLSAWLAVGLVHRWLAGLLLATVLIAAVPGYRAHRRGVVPALFVLGLVVLFGALGWEAALGEAGHTALTAAGSLILIAAHTLNWRYRPCGHTAP